MAKAICRNDMPENLKAEPPPVSKELHAVLSAVTALLEHTATAPPANTFIEVRLRMRDRSRAAPEQKQRYALLALNHISHLEGRDDGGTTIEMDGGRIFYTTEPYKDVDLWLG